MVRRAKWNASVMAGGARSPVSERWRSQTETRLEEPAHAAGVTLQGLGLIKSAVRDRSGRGTAADQLDGDTRRTTRRV